MKAVYIEKGYDMKVIIKPIPGSFNLNIVDLNQQQIGKFLSVSEFKKTFPDVIIIRNYAE